MANTEPASSIAQLRLREFLPYRLSVLSNTISRGIAELYDREFGLSIWQWRVMAIVGDSPGISATDISQRTAMDKVAVSRAVAGMLEAGLIARRVSQTDGRRSDLQLTPQGQEIYERIVPIAKSAEQALVRSLSSEEQGELSRLLTKLSKAAAPDRELW